MSDEAGQAGKAENGERSGSEDAEDHNLNAPCNMVPASLGGGECDNDSGISAVGGGASEEAGGKVKTDRQDATALMMDKALKKYIKEYGSLKVMDDAKKCLKEMAKTFLGGLLSREELVGSMDPKKISKAVKGWITKNCGVGDTNSSMRLDAPIFTNCIGM